MPLPLHIVDAFADGPFSGNPAAVCLLHQPADGAWMQRVAAEMNLSETAFLVRDGADWNLRWFTPTVEVDLCGHATLAAAHVLWKQATVPETESIRFQSRSGPLIATRSDAGITLDFPADPPHPSEDPGGLCAALDINNPELLRGKDDWVVVTDPETLRRLAPDFAALRAVPGRGVIVTAAVDATTCDFASRFFAPRAGIDEDPATGSAHCTLAPLWAERLDTNPLRAEQWSARGARLLVDWRGDRVFLTGRAVTVLRGDWLSPSP